MAKIGSVNSAVAHRGEASREQSDNREILEGGSSYSGYTVKDENCQAKAEEAAVFLIVCTRSALLGVLVVIAKVSNMLTWHRAACHFYKPPVIITFDEALVAFNAAYLRRMVLFDGGGCELDATRGKQANVHSNFGRGVHTYAAKRSCFCGQF